MALFQIAEPGEARTKEACATAAVGIDLGTTNSLVAVVRPDPETGAGKPRALPVDEGSTLLPSVVAYTGDKTPVVGRAARRLAAEAPRDTIVSVKRFMGKTSADPETRRLSPYRFAEGESGTVRFEVRGRAVTPVEVSAEILRALKVRAGEQLGEFELFRRWSANRQRERFGDENAPREYWQKTFFAVGDTSACGHGSVGEERRAIGNFDAPGVAARFLRRDHEIQLRFEIAEKFVGGLIAGGFVESEPDFSELADGALVRDFDGEFEQIAFAHESRRIGLHHQILGCDGLALQKAGTQTFVMREAEEFPLRERFGHRELELHLAVVVRNQLREKEGRLVQILSGRDGTEVRAFGLWRWCSAAFGNLRMLSKISLYIFVPQSQPGRFSGRCLRHIESHRPCHRGFGIIACAPELIAPKIRNKIIRKTAIANVDRNHWQIPGAVEILKGLERVLER